MSAGDDQRKNKSSTTSFDALGDAYPIPDEGEDPFTAGETIRTDAPVFDFLERNSSDVKSERTVQNATSSPPPHLSLEAAHLSIEAGSEPADAYKTPVFSPEQLDRLRAQARPNPLSSLPKKTKISSGFTSENDPFLGAATEVNLLHTASLPNPERSAKKRYVEGVPTDFHMGGYHVHTQLGQGGMAVVFLARPPGGHHDVVLKRIRPSLLAEEKYVALFKREARIASGLLHPNIVRILDHAEEKGEAFIVMEYLDGTDLRDLAERNWHVGRWLPIEAVLRTVTDSARGLHHAHTKKNLQGECEALVHRDVSPENLFLARDGVTKILDFGIAKEFDDSSNLTKTGEVKGKVPYMSPEQILDKKLDGRTDQWSLAVTTYWLLTGQRPFDGASNFMTIKNIVEKPARAPSLLNPFIPSSVEEILLKALEKDPAQRFRNCNEFADVLDGVLEQKGSFDAALQLLDASADLESPFDEPFSKGPAARPLADWRR